MTIKDFYIFCCDQQTSTVDYAPIMVSGAGINSANGLYTYGGMYQGAPYYNNVHNQYQIYLSSSVNGAWLIEYAGWSGSGAVYETQANLSSPVEGTWTAPYGDTPAPTVEFAYSVLVSGAGTAAANGIYIFDGVYNNFPSYIMDGNVFYSIYKSDPGVNGVWIIASEATDLYENNLSGLISPYNITNPWTRSFTPVFGMPQAPTVTQYPL